MTHAFMYGTATFEGIRGYWNPEAGKLYVLKLREHVERIRQSCRILLMEDVPAVDELAGLILETVARNDFREDVYIRPVVLQVDDRDRAFACTTSRTSSTSSRSRSGTTSTSTTASAS
jgi:branched-chain amino acid aminotransferase